MVKPPEDFKDWSKNALVRECRRLRAIMREHAEQVAPAHSGGSITDVAGNPHAQGGALMDARGSVLLEHTEVMLVDTKRENEPLFAALELEGRINFSTQRARTTYLLGPDGCAALTSELYGLTVRARSSAGVDGVRFSEEFLEALARRMEELP